MTVLPTGPTILIYNPVALASVYGARLSALQDTHPSVDSEDVHRAWEEVKAVDQAPLIVVVDDSITMRRVLQRLLLREGYRVSLAADGSQALDTLRLEKPILVLSDVEMPRMDGFELLRNIRASDRLNDLPVVMITSRIADKHRDHAKSLGANEYLGKPYSEEELLQVLQRYAQKQNH
jgi:chemosensory pili system protein ChpA (sensor histidine kinase/response regulator)